MEVGPRAVRGCRAGCCGCHARAGPVGLLWSEGGLLARAEYAALHVVEAGAAAGDAIAARGGLALGRGVVVRHAMEFDAERGAVEERVLGELVHALAGGVDGAGIHEVLARRIERRPTARREAFAHLGAVDLE